MPRCGVVRGAAVILRCDAERRALKDAALPSIMSVLETWSGAASLLGAVALRGWPALTREQAAPLPGGPAPQGDVAAERVRFESDSRWRPSPSKLRGSSQRSNAAFSAGQSRSTIEYQAVSRLRPL